MYKKFERLGAKQFGFVLGTFMKNLSIIGQFMALIKHLAVMVIHCILEGMDFFVVRAINTDKKRPNR